MTKLDWQALGYDYACQHCHAVVLLHERKSDSAEYGLNWDEFINTCADEIYPLLDAWWPTYDKDSKRAILENARLYTKGEQEGLNLRIASIEAQLSALDALAQLSELDEEAQLSELYKKGGLFDKLG